MNRPGPKLRVYPESEVSLVRSEYERGKTIAEVAAMLGRSGKYVSCIMNRAGIQARVPKNLVQFGERNPNWKGDKCGKDALHSRLYTRFGKPTKCSVCGTTSAKVIEYANLSERYLSIYDFAPMCRSCHCKHEGRGVRLSAAAKKARRA